MEKDYICPNCGYLKHGEGPEPPKPGYSSICFNCGVLLQYDETLDLVPLDWSKFEELDQDTRVNIMFTQLVILERGRVYTF